MRRSHAPVAQLDRVLVSEAKGHRFDSCRARQIFFVFLVTRFSCFVKLSPALLDLPEQKRMPETNGLIS